MKILPFIQHLQYKKYVSERDWIVDTGDYIVSSYFIAHKNRVDDMDKVQKILEKNKSLSKQPSYLWDISELIENAFKKMKKVTNEDYTYRGNKFEIDGELYIDDWYNNKILSKTEKWIILISIS